MHRDEKLWSAWHKPLYNYQESQEHSGTYGNDEIQPDIEENDSSQGDQVNLALTIK
jgi:hypothetical protein